MKFIFSSKQLDVKKASDFQGLKQFELKKASLLINDPNTLLSSDNIISVVNGYLKDFEFDDDRASRIAAAAQAISNWPVKDSVTGSFSAFLLSEEENKISICSDLANIYPLYYLQKDGDLFISNSIILMGRYSGAEHDKTGIVQRAIGPDFMDKGSRTILKNCKRLLPGEWLQFDLKGNLLEKRYDNSLYRNLSGTRLSKGMIEDYWAHYKKEVALCTAGFDEVNIALSGGIDSRIALGAIPSGKKINAYTFGASKNYEVRIAGKLARKKGAHHTNFSDLSLYFPKKQVLLEYIRETEAVKLNSWLEILENVHPKEKQPILLGELCEGLPARNIKKFNTSHFRKENFLKFYVKKEQFPFTASNPETFEKWKDQKRQHLISWYDENWFKKLQFSENRKEIIDDTISDIDEIFTRIEAHHLPYVELYDELFSWFTFTRMELSRQVNICNEKFYAFSPGMSLQMLKKTSNIHPNLRLFYRFANKMLKEVPELKPFRNIPTSQIPLLPQQSPDFSKFPCGESVPE